MISTLFALVLSLPAGDDDWSRLAACESGGDPTINGAYDGMYQFAPSTWNAMGGTDFAPYAYQASASEQTIVAQRLYDQVGWSAWPGCAARLGLSGDPGGSDGGSSSGGNSDPSPEPTEQSAETSGGLPVTR